MANRRPAAPEIRTSSGPLWAVLAVISLGGGLGGLARYAVGWWSPPDPHGFPWPVFAVNVSGCLLIGVLMVLVTEVWPQRRLLRPFLGVGVLGGYTTFSLPMVQAHHLITTPAIGVALLYLAATAVSAVAAVAAGIAVTRWHLRRRSPGQRSPRRREPTLQLTDQERV